MEADKQTQYWIFNDALEKHQYHLSHTVCLHHIFVPELLIKHYVCFIKDIVIYGGQSYLPGCVLAC